MFQFRDLLLNLAVLPLYASASPQLRARQGAAPSITISNGTVVGTTSKNVDSFKGIPFAQPPIGDLRLRAPQSLTQSFGTITSNDNPKSCPQFFFDSKFPPDSLQSLPTTVLGILTNLPTVQSASNAGEDCLTLNVQRPTGTTKDSKLPVAVWIYGGGFELGSTQTYDGASIVTKSVDMGAPILYVAMNYRVGGFGFLAGKELSVEGSTNLGLRDQRLALQWVQDNIAAFGGDPEKVTIWGESAGSISVFDHTVINGGDNTYNGKPLFHGAIMNSGTLVPTQDATSPKAQGVFTNVTQTAGCSGSADVLACLRALSYEDFLSAVNGVPGLLGSRSLDLSYLPRPDSHDNFFSSSPELSVLNGKFAKVPIMVGDMEDEGTLFALSTTNLITNDDVVDYFASYFTGNSNAEQDVAGFLATYPDQPLLGQPSGSPFGSGSLWNIYPEFKRWAAASGDATFTLTRRIYLDVVSSQVRSWSYLNSYLKGTPILGTFHGTDIFLMFGILELDKTPAGQTIQTHIVSFINSLDPNTLAGGDNNKSGLINWPQYNTQDPQLLHIQSLSNALITDDFRKSSSDYLSSKPSSFRA